MHNAHAEGKQVRNLITPDHVPSRPHSVSCRSNPGSGRPYSEASVTTGLRTSSVTPSGYANESKFAPRPATCESHMVEDFPEDRRLSLPLRPKSEQEVCNGVAWSARAHPIRVAYSDYPSHLESQLPIRLDAGFGRGFGPRKPPSWSPHESSLRSTEAGWHQDQIAEACLTETALEKDKSRLEHKYKDAIRSRFQPMKMDSARYHVKLPQTPQHMKYVRRNPETMVFTHEQASSSKAGTGRKTMKRGQTATCSLQISEGMPKTRQRVAYNIKRLETWFKLMDTNSSGEVTVRKLIVGMMKHQELCDLFYILKDGGKNDIWGMNPNDRPKVGHLTRDDMDWIREILTDLDQDGNSSMDWPEFVDFFRSAGLLLEYSTRPELNQSHLGETDIDLYRKKQEEDRKEQQNKFFNETRRGAQAAPGHKSNKETMASKRKSRAPNARHSDCSQAQTT
eukprot:TRINITY_DN74771_c0_g1_i1.p1 TRINITY_DN74771_c0_g1~~TRINITY_DN74771_c0_g1_i1.p1  ORF type:complete len:451 (-),score=48.25 TRINITY_DN74771_c0_g1_i1:183-1535(-)